MRKTALIIIGIFALLLPVLAQANESTPLSYSRADIAIVRRAPGALPWQKQGQGAVDAQRRILFNVEVRDAMTLYNQKGWFSLSAPAENGGVMMLFAKASMSPVVPAAQYAPLDILMINSEGTIVQIVPDVRLSDLRQDIAPPEPVLAFLFIKGGDCKKFSIAPGDSVEYPLFQKPPAVLTLTPPSPAAQAAPLPWH